MAIKVGDLAEVSYFVDRKYAYIELRDAIKRVLYAMPRIVMDPNDIVVVLRLHEDDALILTSSGKTGWLEVDKLQTVAAAPISLSEA